MLQENDGRTVTTLVEAATTGGQAEILGALRVARQLMLSPIWPRFLELKALLNLCLIRHRHQILLTHGQAEAVAFQVADQAIVFNQAGAWTECTQAIPSRHDQAKV